MTNEEAKKILKQFRDRQGNSSDDIEAFDIAINALEQIPLIPDVENNYNIGYNCGYADAMFDIAEGSDDE